MKPLVSVAVLVALVHISQSFPRFYHRGWLRLLREGDDCGQCNLDLCSKVMKCPAGTVPDECGCCFECGNVEGQICDLDNTSRFYGLCGENLECKLNADERKFGDTPEPQCICKSQETVCGSDGKSYENICRFKEELHTNSKTNVTIKHEGPCATAPVISLPPQDAQNFTGNDVIFSCEVSAYPMANVEWKKKGKDSLLPGDDAHVSIQARGGPQKYGITGWLQIQGLKKSDEGIYTCYTKNEYGEAFASAQLRVIDQDLTVKVTVSSRITNFIIDDEDYYDETVYIEEDYDEEYQSGRYDD
ncbi:kazal-type serine protease inhibitor domain-containing protein 1-like [Latimeria chalumnae]|uniref:kazal-type serine protease inhibitor domain-containing protein 1-like n=1 Tax=Latimeria chalumnae TaxID=7897 RepID=UPI0003C16C9C|nr:PREDICTED: kazal-type serine protease inhibitor domain-containing protein 1-like [Latimeria chalumnae]|eukprot:XP_006002507.1 PREDICTED: kazal-type serine protease inhibitor domain-containing protein 1-like [Latimeria chalumnae]